MALDGHAPGFDHLAPLEFRVLHPDEMRGEVVQRVAVRRELPVHTDQGRLTAVRDDHVVPVEVRVEQAVRAAGHGGDPLGQPGQRVLGNAQRGEQSAEGSPIGLTDLTVRKMGQCLQKGLAVSVVEAASRRAVAVTPPCVPGTSAPAGRPAPRSTCCRPACRWGRSWRAAPPPHSCGRRSVPRRARHSRHMRQDITDGGEDLRLVAAMS